MNFIKKLILCVSSLALLCGAAYAEGEDVKLIKDGVQLYTERPPVIVNSRTLVPMRAIFESYGAEVNWYDGTEIVTAVLGETEVTLQIGSNEMTVNDYVIELEAAPEIIDDKTMVPVRAVSEAFGSTVEWYEQDRIVAIRTPAESNPVMDGTIISDDFRYVNYDGVYNGVSVFDNEGEDYFGMELIGISDDSGSEYADIVSEMAAELPNTRVFCGVVPTAGEFYASAPYRTNYLMSVSKIYNCLSPEVIPINIEQAMMDRADEYIYFRTDHHWTQLGAYYAYREFCAVSGNIPPELDEFERRNIKNYLGSWVKMTADTDGFDMLGSSPDTIELYMPRVEYEGMSYSDMDMTVSPYKRRIMNTAFGNYNIFLEGDYPLEVYQTEVDNGKSICIIKESYGNAFSSWLINNYEDVFIVDYRMFNGNNSNPNVFKIKDFCEMYDVDDLLVLSYPYTVEADDLRGMLGGLCADISDADLE